MEKFQKSDQFYKQNKFPECCETLRKLLPHLTGKCTEDPHFILECMVTNNLNVCSALAEIVRNSFENSWEPKLRNFISHFNNWKSTTVLPLQLLFTLGYNALHWYWMMPKSQKRKDKFYYEILNVAEECFKKVLEESKANIIGHSDQVESEENLIWLMESASNQIPKLNNFLTIALIKLLNIMYLIFMKKLNSSQFFQRSFESNEKQMQGIRQLGKSHKSDRRTKSSSVPSTKSGYYTFGFKNLNSVFDDTADACVTAFYLTCTLNLIIFNRMEKAAEYLRGYEISDTFSSFAFYLRAYCLFQLNHLDEAYMTLSSMQNLPLNDLLKFHFHILLGKYFSEKKMLKEATTEFMKAKSISIFLAPEALYYLFKSCQKDNSLMQVRFLDEIHQSIKKSGDSDASWKMSEVFESGLLSMLHMYPAISEEEVLYLLAKVNLQHKKYAVAEKFYSRLLKILKTSCDIVNLDSEKRLAPLPKVHIIYHETIKSLIDSDNPHPEVALKLCQSCLDDFIPSSSFHSHSVFASNSGPGGKYFDEFLNALDEDCISLILLSQTYFLMNEDSKALDFVERCTEIVTMYIGSKKSDISVSDQNSSKSEELTFFKCFLAKLFLCKAILLKNMGKNTNELIPLCKKALSFNNGDSDVLFYYAQFLTKQNQHEEAAALRNTKRFDLDTERCFSEALKSFIELHAVEDKWGQSDSPEDMVADLFENSGDYFDSLSKEGSSSTVIIWFNNFQFITSLWGFVGPRSALPLEYPAAENAYTPISAITL